MIYIYTDGACSNNQSEQNFGGWAAILVYSDYIKKLSGHQENTTNNRMEMTGVLEGLKSLKRHDIPVRVFSDSAYIVNGINQKWYLNWRKNGWKNAKKEPVLNRDLWEAILEHYEKCRNIEFIKIKGHVNLNSEPEIKKSYEKERKAFSDPLGIGEYRRHLEFNHMADELAVNAAKDGRIKE